MAGVPAFPLQWPANKPRTPAGERERSRFRTTPGKARDELLREISRLGGSAVVISSNVPVRRDGFPMANRSQPEDTGVAVYFLDKNGRQKCFTCDRWRAVEENLWAVRCTIEALRGIERWGSGDMVEAAFSGFTALPPASAAKGWWMVLGCNVLTETESVLKRYRALSMERHPDRGGTHEQMAALNKALDEFKKERGLT